MLPAISAISTGTPTITSAISITRRIIHPPIDPRRYAHPSVSAHSDFIPHGYYNLRARGMPKTRRGRLKDAEPRSFID